MLTKQWFTSTNAGLLRAYLRELILGMFVEQAPDKNTAPVASAVAELDDLRRIKHKYAPLLRAVDTSSPPSERSYLPHAPTRNVLLCIQNCAREIYCTPASTGLSIVWKSLQSSVLHPLVCGKVLKYRWSPTISHAGILSRRLPSMTTAELGGISKRSSLHPLPMIT